MFIRKKGTFISKWKFYLINEQYLQSKGIFCSRHSLGTENTYRYQNIYESVEEEFEDEQSKELLSYIDVCIDWATAKNKKKITKGDIDLFFYEKNLKIPSDMYIVKDIFYRKVKEII
jgi:hypothetical protein